MRYLAQWATLFVRNSYQSLFMAALFIGVGSESVAEPAPLRGNPVDALPKVNEPVTQPLTIQVKKPEVDPALQKLLNRHLTPSQFKIIGVKSLPFDQVAAYFSGLVNRDTTVAELLAAANQVTQMYKDHDYPLSFAFIPAQDFANNVVVVNVVEAYVSQVKIESDRNTDYPHLRAIAEQLKQDKPLRYSTFQRVAGILGLQPGLKIDASIQPPTTTDGASTLVLSVRHQPITLGLGVDFRDDNPRSVLTVTENSFTSLGEQLSVSVLPISGQLHEHYYAVNYAQPIGINGMLGKLSWSDYRADPTNSNLTKFQLQSRYHTQNKRFAASLSYPLILDNLRNLTVNASAYAVEDAQVYTRSVVTTPMQVRVNNNARVLNAGLSWTNVDPGPAIQQSRQASFNVYKGVDGLGASQENSSAALSFSRFALQLFQANQWNSGIGTVIAASAQYSNHVLPNSEQINFGGRSFGMAYAAGEVAGDKGWGISAEINYLFSQSMTYLKTIQPYFLADQSRVLSNAFSLQHNKLASLGFGVRFSDRRYYTLDIALAQPVADKPFNATSRTPQWSATYSIQF